MAKSKKKIDPNLKVEVSLGTLAMISDALIVAYSHVCRHIDPEQAKEIITDLKTKFFEKDGKE